MKWEIADKTLLLTMSLTISIRKLEYEKQRKHEPISFPTSYKNIPASNTLNSSAFCLIAAYFLSNNGPSAKPTNIQIAENHVDRYRRRDNINPSKKASLLWQQPDPPPRSAIIKPSSVSSRGNKPILTTIVMNKEKYKRETHRVYREGRWCGDFGGSDAGECFDNTVLARVR